MEEALVIEVASKFATESVPTSGIPYGMGHINDTYLIGCESGAKYILQRINSNVFKNVDALMANIRGVTEYIGKVNKNLPKEEILRVIPTKFGKAYFKSEEGLFFRMYNFIAAGVSIEVTPTEQTFYLCGKGFGKFQNQLDGYPSETLTESIPKFHNTVNRFEAFEKAINEDKFGRVGECKAEIDFYLARKSYTYKVVDMLKNGAMPLRVTHNDTKLNNVLVNIEENRASAVIDLDTVMPGSILYDFGDSIRSGANTGAEDEKDLTKVHFSPALYEAYSKGFLEEVGEKLTKTEREMLPFGAILMTYECGMRFLTDYLSGDTYFRTKYAGHNLVRTRTQMRMVEEMEAFFNVKY